MVKVWYDEVADIERRVFDEWQARNQVREIFDTMAYFRSTGISGRRAKLLSDTHMRTQRDMQEQRMYSERYGLGIRGGGK